MFNVIMNIIAVIGALFLVLFGAGILSLVYTILELFVNKLKTVYDK